MIETCERCGQERSAVFLSRGSREGKLLCTECRCCCSGLREYIRVNAYREEGAIGTHTLTVADPFLYLRDEQVRLNYCPFCGGAIAAHFKPKALHCCHFCEEDVVCEAVWLNESRPIYVCLECRPKVDNRRTVWG